MATRFNSPIERLGHASGITGWGWIFIGLVVTGLLIAGWFSYFYWQQNKSSEISRGNSLPAETREDLVYIRSIQQQDGRYYASIDPVEWLTGIEAEQQAQADGLCQASSTSCITNGFYLRNATTTTEMVLLSQQAHILMQTLSLTATGTPQWDESIAFDRWQNLFLDPASRWYQVPFRLMIRDNEAVGIKEQYVP